MYVVYDRGHFTCDSLQHYWFVSTDMDKAVVGGPAGPAMAGPLFYARNGLRRTTFLAKYFFAGPFSHVSSRPSLMIYFSMFKD